MSHESEIDIVPIETKYVKIADLKIMNEKIKSSDLKLLYLNISSIKQNLDKLTNLLAVTKYLPDIIALTETKITTTVNQEYYPNLPNYTFINTPSVINCGGAGMFIKNTLNFTSRNDLNQSKDKIFETIWVDVFTGKNKTNKCTIGCIYRHGSTDLVTFNNYLDTVFAELSKTPTKFYICGDFNLDTLKRKECPKIANFIDNMISHNTTMLINKPTRFPIGNQSGSPSILDHIYTNAENYVTNLGLLLTDITDHLPIFLVIQSSLIHKVSGKDLLTRDYNKVDPVEFNSLIEEINPYINANTPSIDEKFDKFQKHLVLCIDKLIPLRKLTKREISFKVKPWISKGLQKSIIYKNKLYAKIIKNNRHDLKPEYNIKKKILEKLLTIAKRNYFTYKINCNKDNPKSLWKIINDITNRKKQKQNNINCIKLGNGTSITDHKNIANELNKYFVNIGPKLARRINPTQKNYRHYLKKLQPNSFFIDPTDPMEIQSLIHNFSTHKAAGPDQISIKAIKLGALSISVILSNLINQAFQTGIFPKSLKEARITPIFKGGDSELTNNYRPISIISVISKLFEKLISKRLIKYLNKYNIINDNQFGFRPSHSTTHAITNINEYILNNIESNKHIISIFLDLSKAFDCVNHTILLDKLYQCGIRGTSYRLFQSYLSGRVQYTTIKDCKSDAQLIKCGVPQGSILGPLLFLIYINDLCEASDFKVSLYADDTCLLMSHKNLHTLVQCCNNELVKIDNWFRANELTANIVKASKFMVTYGKRNHTDSNIQIKMGDLYLERVNQIKYLGVTLDDQFTWKAHIQYVRKKLSSSCGILSKLRHYIDVETLKKVYFALFQSHLQYAIICWGSANKSDIQPLKIIQNRAMRYLYKASRYTRLDFIYLNLRILKLEDLFKLEISKLMHQHYNNKLPNLFSEYFLEVRKSHQRNTRAAKSLNYVPIRCKKKTSERSVKYIGPKEWNNLPYDIQTAKKTNFKKLLINFLLSKL